MKNSCASKRRNIQSDAERNARPKFTPGILFSSATSLAFPIFAYASVESSLAAVQDKLVGTLLPLAAMCGLVIAGLSFVAGHPQARQHLIYAIVGAIVGFGSESIVSFIRNLIH